MFDYHLHTTVSFDGVGTAQELVSAAQRAGLKEICFTDHYDHNSDPSKDHKLFTLEADSAAYNFLTTSDLKIRRGVEFGLTTLNQPHLEELLHTFPFDFVIGSVHFIDGYDPYEAAYWENLTPDAAFRKYLLGTLECVKAHHNFDVLGHLTYVCKSVHNPTRKPVPFKDHLDITDEIMKILITKGIGMEINTSGVDRTGTFLPSADYLKRFKELGGEIVTVGSDAHDMIRVGQYVPEALEILKDIFGYVCTFENRKPIFHKL